MEKKMLEDLQKILNEVKWARENDMGDYAKMAQNDYFTLAGFVSKVLDKSVLVKNWVVYIEA